MAYTIYTPGSGKFSANLPVIFTALEDTNRIANDDYKYICDIYISADIVARLKAVPDPATGQGIFDIGPVIRSYIEQSATLNTGITAGSLTPYVEVQCKFGDEYGGTLYTNVTVDSSRRFYNYYQQWPNLNSDVLTEFNSQWLSSRPLTMTIDTDAKGLILPFYQTSGANFDLRIKTYNSAGQVNSYAITISNTDTDKVLMFDVSRQNLEDVYSYATEEDLEYLTVQASGVSGTTQTYRVNLECQKKYQTIPVVWMNKWGAYESYHFTKAHSKNIEIERKEYQQQGYTVGASGVISYATSNTYQRRRMTYSQQARQRWTLKTDLLTDSEWAWLGELIQSPEVFVIVSGYLVPVVMLTNNYEDRYFTKDSLQQLTIDIELSGPHNTQFL